MIYLYCAAISFGVNACSLSLIVWALKRQMTRMLTPPKPKRKVADAAV